MYCCLLDILGVAVLEATLAPIAVLEAALNPIAEEVDVAVTTLESDCTCPLLDGTVGCMNSLLDVLGVAVLEATLAPIAVLEVALSPIAEDTDVAVFTLDESSR